MYGLAQIKRQPIRALFLIIIGLAILGLGLFFPAKWIVPAVAAQSTGDTLPTRPPTPIPTVTATRPPTLTPTPERKIWVARLASNTPGFTLGQGSIFRVKVDGLVGALIELRSDDELITGLSGSKPEYGAYTAEFAPVTKGTWLVSVPSLGLDIPVTADNYNLAVIEFVQVAVSEATPRIDTPSPTPTPLDGFIWQGRLVSEVPGPVVGLSRLLVQVTGLSHHPVRLSTAAEIINTANTGQKPDELGPDVVEFTGLTPAKYFVEPLGLNSRFEVELKPNIESRLVFRPSLPPTTTFTPPAPTATQTPGPPTPTPTFSVTPTPTATPTPTLTPTSTDTVTPVPSPTPVTQWLGAIEERSDVGTELSAVVVKVPGIEGLSVQLRAMSNGPGQRRCITGQGTDGQDACSFVGLTPGQYGVSPEGLGLSLPVMVFANEKVQVTFELQVLPPGITGWQARLIKNTNKSQAVPSAEATIRVRVNGRTGQVIALRSARGLERLCEVVPNPVLGSLACEFGQLSPGVYLVEALNTGAGQRLYVDGVGLAEIEFSPNATYASQAVAQAPPVVGQGAQPYRPSATTTPLQIQVMATRPMPGPGPTSTPTSTATPAPTFAWQGKIVETVNNVAGAIGVRAAGLKDHPVILRSGGWQSPVQLTGSKIELGEYAAEFGGLAQGEYMVELMDLAELKVDLGPDQFILVEFRYDFVDPP